MTQSQTTSLERSFEYAFSQYHKTVTIYSKSLQRNINVPAYRSIREPVTCIDLDRLQHIREINTGMISIESHVMEILKLYDTCQCGNKKTDSWYWKITPSQDYKLLRYSIVEIDNTISWKEHLILALEQQKVNAN